ncbi:hypothetical protein E2C01_002329 [Portunus trituberculatus]|uniref:Uncharacterized protein n=1 Tax=Portunus trituberculatus TaxID=210409 RepID=A0A5B7CK35_PORTR|nr:hypothetical protein [Portunus trituberculatus]
MALGDSGFPLSPRALETAKPLSPILYPPPNPPPPPPLSPPSPPPGPPPHLPQENIKRTYLYLRIMHVLSAQEINWWSKRREEPESVTSWRKKVKDKYVGSVMKGASLRAYLDRQKEEGTEGRRRREGRTGTGDGK